jgi:hypothetical protein
MIIGHNILDKFEISKQNHQENDLTNFHIQSKSKSKLNLKNLKNLLGNDSYEADQKHQKHIPMFYQKRNEEIGEYFGNP